MRLDRLKNRNQLWSGWVKDDSGVSVNMDERIVDKERELKRFLIDIYLAISKQQKSDSRYKSDMDGIKSIQYMFKGIIMKQIGGAIQTKRNILCEQEKNLI